MGKATNLLTLSKLRLEKSSGEKRLFKVVLHLKKTNDK